MCNTLASCSSCCRSLAHFQQVRRLHCSLQCSAASFCFIAHSTRRSARFWESAAWTVIPAGLVLHSWAGSANMTQMLAKIEGVHFSISGHLTALKQVKAEAMLQQVRLGKPCLAAA